MPAPAVAPARPSARGGRAFGRLSAVALLACAGLGAACTAVVTQRVETVIRHALPRTVGAAQRYDVSVQGVSDDASRFDRVRVVGLRVAREGAPGLDRLEADLGAVQIDRAGRRIVSIGSAAVTADLLDGDLAAHLAARGWIDEATVAFRAPSEVVASGRLKAPGLAFGPTVAAEFRGRLLARGSRLHPSVDTLRLGATAAPALVRSALEAAIDPVVDAASFAVPSRIDAVAVEGAVLRIRGSGADLTLPPRRADAAQPAS